MSWNSLCKPGSKDLPASAHWMLELKICATTTGLVLKCNNYFIQVWLFMACQKTLWIIKSRLLKFKNLFSPWIWPKEIIPWCSSVLTPTYQCFLLHGLSRSHVEATVTLVRVQTLWIWTFQSTGMWIRNVRQTKQKYKRNKQRHGIESGEQPSEYWIGLSFYIPQSKTRRWEAKDFFAKQ